MSIWGALYTRSNAVSKISPVVDVLYPEATMSASERENMFVCYLLRQQEH